jgi:hypothetical protein
MKNDQAPNRKPPYLREEIPEAPRKGLMIACSTKRRVEHLLLLADQIEARLSAAQRQARPGEALRRRLKSEQSIVGPRFWQ